VGRESASEKVCDSAQQSVVFLGKRVFDVTVDIYLADDMGAASNEYDDFRTSLVAAGEIVFQSRDIAYDLVCTLGHRDAAYTFAYRNVRMVGGLANVVVKHERIAFKQIYADPVVKIAFLFEDLDGAPKHFVSRGCGVNNQFNFAYDLVSGLHLFRKLRSLVVN